MPGYTLRVLKGPQPQKGDLQRGDALTFGAAEPADVIFAAAGVANCHARITHHGGQWQLEDLGSLTGTSRNGQRLLGPVQLFDGDEIGLGETVLLRFEGGGAIEEDMEELNAGMEPGLSA